MEKVESEDGFQMVIHKVSVPDDKVQKYQGKLGSVIDISVKAFSSKGKVIYYGV